MIKPPQVRVTLHALPNRADTDGDGRNDSEELNLGSDGYRPNPWKDRRRPDAKRCGPERCQWHTPMEDQ